MNPDDLKATPDFVTLIDAVAEKGYKNVVILYLRPDKLCEAYIETQRTEGIEDPHMALMMAVVESVVRHRMASRGEEQPKTGKDWAKMMGRTLLGIAMGIMAREEGNATSPDMVSIQEILRGHR
jgi:hypothetical protein